MKTCPVCAGHRLHRWRDAICTGVALDAEGQPWPTYRAGETLTTCPERNEVR